HAAATTALAERDLRASDALLPVTNVEVRQDLQRGEVVMGIRTPFGVTPVRPADYVARKYDWQAQRVEIRAPRAIYDIDFSTTIDADPEASDPVETAVLLNRGLARLTPGPDAFVFLKHRDVANVRVAPLLRAVDGTLSRGASVSLDDSGALADVSVSGKNLHGFAVDLDMWVERGLVARDSDIMGLVIAHDGEPGAGTLAIAEIIASDAPLFSVGPNGAGGGGIATLFSLGDAGFRGAGGGGGGAPGPNNTEIPAPGAGLLFGLGLAAAAARRRR
ncbi:MAG: PEP-CTERM sorting domain-containing protein, partial [Phycisphaerales bacterium]